MHRREMTAEKSLAYLYMWIFEGKKKDLKRVSNSTQISGL